MKTLFALALISLQALAQAADLQIATGEFPPYATASRADQGIALSIVRRAFELDGHQVKFTFLPWSRAQLETEAGKWDASAHWGASDERRKKFLLSDNLLSEQWVFLHRRAMAFDWMRLEDLQSFVIGMTRDYTYTPELWSAARAGTLISSSVPNDLAGLKMLQAGRIDVLPLERNVACDLLVQHFDDAAAGQIAAHPRAMTDQFTTHVLFPKGKGASPHLLADFNRGLKKLRESPEYAKLKANVRCPSSWALVRSAAPDATWVAALEPHHDTRFARNHAPPVL
ncbi:polar amino acid transport system substrate-binding protein [Inhella inkyongensis]|uniref:Polar amino acid transport system substrate-binding protein n=1 Tax=Inhella inkyongensis TaxID=392593 RepID=A0A840S3L2_9BURK|nr:transporter substrate-binding domain-containing protein [Inhella inkyongensis]MBB5203251.1 polar amino acid transport system substrate-binding protein [Inhella inkyongensis]